MPAGAFSAVLSVWGGHEEKAAIGEKLPMTA